MKKSISSRLVDQHHKQPTLSYDDDQEKLFNEESLKQSKAHSYDYGDQDELMAKVSVLVFILVSALSVWANKGWLRYQFSVQVKSVDQYLVQAFMGLDEDLPSKYLQIENIGQFYAELPFCIVLAYRRIQDAQPIKESILDNIYENYIILQYEILEEKQTNANGEKKDDKRKEKNKKTQQKNSKDSYLEIISVIKQKCPQKSILFFPNQPLSIDSLQKQNALYQTYNTWLLYGTQMNVKMPQKNSREKIIFQEQIQSIEIVSMYRRLLQLVYANDFERMNRRLLSRPWDSGHLAASLLELCKFYSFPIQSEQFYAYNSSSSSAVSQKYSLYHKFENIIQKNKETHRRVPYQPLHSLNQDYIISDIDELDSNRRAFFESNYTLTEMMGIFPRDSVATHEQMERALQFQQLLYLPENHLLTELEIKRMEQTYQSGKYSENELPLCININSFNNVQNQRYKKVINSVVAQNYTNYKIVFIDDSSTDETLNKTKHHLEETLQFPKERVTYVRNSVNKKATYNILNAAFNFCQKDSIQILIDGDDQLIGKQVFKVVSAQYQAHDLWTLYTFYKYDKYKEGISIPFENQVLRNSGGGRKLAYFFSQVKSFKVSLIRRIPLSEHLDLFGSFFGTIYDTALQYPIFELAGGEKHGRFINQIMYLYSYAYGANDDSNIFKIAKRNLWHFFLTFRPPLKQLAVLDSEKQDRDVRKMLEQGRDKQYKIVA